MTKTWIGKDLNVSRLHNFLLVASSIKWVEFICLCVGGKEIYLENVLRVVEADCKIKSSDAVDVMP